jgi:hypothetical protein
MKRYTFLFTFLSILIITSNIKAQWLKVSSGMGDKTLYSLTCSGNNIFAGTDNYGVYLSTNNGMNWTQTSLANNYIYSLAISGNCIFAGTDLGVYLSTNNGASWNQTSLNNRSIASLAINGNNIFARTDNYGVYLSTNNGMNWLQWNEGFFISYITIYSFCIINNNIFAGTGGNGVSGGNGVYRRPLAEVNGIKPITEQITAHYSLSQNYPNPFNPSTAIEFDIPKASLTKLIIYDLLGKEVNVLVNEELKAGIYKINFDGSNLSSGVYFYKLIASEFTLTKKMVLVK